MLKLLRNKPRASSLPNHGNFFTTSSHKPITELANPTNSQSHTLSYLQNSCGFSSKSAISVSKKLNLAKTHNLDSLLNLLRSHGLTKTHIKNLITKRPLLLSADVNNTLKPNLELFNSLGITDTNLAKMLHKFPGVLETDAKTTVEFLRANGFSDKQIASLTMKRPVSYIGNPLKNLKPKLEFFKSLGFSEIDIAKMLSAEPYILDRSLENHIIPCVQLLRRALGTDENVIKAIRARYPLLESSVGKLLEPNISMLISHGIPESSILKLIMMNPRSLLLRTDRFNEIVDEVKKLGFDPDKWLFVSAIRCMAVMSKAVWEKKLEAYMSFGLTKDDVYSAFKVQPMCMIVSEEKIRKLMCFFVNKLGMDPLVIAKYPIILTLSLETRIMPRCSVLQLLMSNGLIKRDLSLANLFRMTEKEFTEKFLKKYQHMVPEVIMAHQGKIKFQGLPSDLKL